MGGSTSVRLVPASTFSIDELALTFTESFEGYAVPMDVDGPTFRRMAELFDIDADASLVAVRGDERVGLVNVGLRGRSAWIGGMGVTARERRGGIGEALMRAAHESAAERGAAEVWLEVITTNEPAIRLYEKLGYEHVRELEIWAVEPVEAQASAARETGARERPRAAPGARAVAAGRRDARARARRRRDDRPGRRRRRGRRARDGVGDRRRADRGQDRRRRGGRPRRRARPRSHAPADEHPGGGRGGARDPPLRGRAGPAPARAAARPHLRLANLVRRFATNQVRCVTRRRRARGRAGRRPSAAAGAGGRRRARRGASGSPRTRRRRTRPGATRTGCASWCCRCGTSAPGSTHPRRRSA